MIHRRQFHSGGRLPTGFAALFDLVLTASIGALAQQPERTSNPRLGPVSNSASPRYDLAKDDLDLVAASAIQLKEVPMQDCGLTEEMKRWITPARRKILATPVPVLT
jgi:hypothetical protein